MRRRILRAVVVAVVCAVVLFSVPLAVATLRLYRQDEVRELQQLADRVAVTVPADVHHPRDPMELPRVESDTWVGVYDDGARLVIGAGPARGDGSVREALAGRDTSSWLGDRLVAAVPVGSGERVRAVVRASSPADGPLRRAALTWAGMLALAAVAVGVGAVLGIRSSRRLARPLEALAVTAGRLETGDLAARAAPSGLSEADEVAVALNRAAARIEELLRRERAFSADASHQLRTALTRVRWSWRARRQRARPRTRTLRCAPPWNRWPVWRPRWTTFWAWPGTCRSRRRSMWRRCSTVPSGAGTGSWRPWVGR